MTSLSKKLWQPASRLNLFSLIQISSATTVLAGVAVIAILAIASPCLTSLLEFDRAALGRGQWWRLLTGHLTHWNFDHLFWDLATCLGLATVCLKRSIRNTLYCLLGSALAISLSIWFWQPEIILYRGLSGIDSALFTLLSIGLLKDAYRQRDWLFFYAALLGLVGFFVKTGYEIGTGQTLFVDSTAASFVPLASAHAVGGLMGGLVAASQGHTDKITPVAT